MYRVTINQEGPRQQWVARDDNGSKRSWGEHVAGLDQSRPQEVAEYLFHADEIISAELFATGIVVHIREK